ncbi:MAG: glycosyltransferase family 2 protein [Elusimicrobia bacterium]|nr:glycosyltransferase family 2 protein [Elusimicrobiota bacterium]
MRKLSVLVPVYNEEATVCELLSRVRRASVPLEKEIIVVDDGSTDGTAEILKGPLEPEIRVFFHGTNRGKGAAIRTALEHVAGDFVLIQDADLEYDPDDYGALLKPLLEGKADVSYGSRFLGSPHRVLLFWHYLANRGLTLAANVLYDVNLTDMGTCYKAFAADKIKAIPLRSDRWGIEAEITAKVCKAGLRIFEVPVSYSGRTYAEGKKITWTAALSYIGCLLKYRVLD